VTPAELKAVTLLALSAQRAGAEGACDALENAAPRFRWLTPAERWAMIDVARRVREVIR
jgi:hypothetical protein